MTSSTDQELAYYRAIEDLFATLRGVPHVLSPKDFQLLRQWWRDEVPLSAVRSGVTEVFARRRERGEGAPVVSLTYCRHAVREHARRAAEMAVGTTGRTLGEPSFDTASELEALVGRLDTAAARLRPGNPKIAAVVDRFAAAVTAAGDVPSMLLEEHLFALESALLSNCLEALGPDARDAIERRAREESDATAASAEARERTYRALRDRLVRAELELPRLEVGG